MRKVPAENKFHEGSGADGKHYWLTPPSLYAELDERYSFDFDPCPYPKPDDFDGLTAEWGRSNYVNPPFGAIMHEGKKKGMTAWVRKALAERDKGKRVVMVYPLDKWVLMLLESGAKVSNLRDVRWLATEDGSEGKGTGRHIACFVLEPHAASAPDLKDRVEELQEEIRGLAAWLRESASANPSALNVTFNKFALIQTAERLEKLASVAQDVEEGRQVA